MPKESWEGGRLQDRGGGDDREKWRFDWLRFDLGKRRVKPTSKGGRVDAGFIATAGDFGSRNIYIDRHEGALDVASMGNKTYMHSGRIATNGHHQTHLAS